MPTRAERATPAPGPSGGVSVMAYGTRAEHSIASGKQVGGRQRRAGWARELRRCSVEARAAVPGPIRISRTGTAACPP